jgi:N-methylhydantoinase B
MEKDIKQHKEFWNGINHAYIPQKPLDIPSQVKLHTEFTEEIDPITYEVVRHSLWNVNQEHGRVIENLAVSPITLETRDFQTSLHMEDGQIILFGPYLQYFSGALDLMIQYVLEKRVYLGVQDGDMYLQNDPWVGSPHQPDVGVFAPVFWEGQIFCWVANCMHQNDIGGTVPGSFCPNAQDVFWDPPSFPPIKIVKKGEIDPELEAVYLRQSRTPDNLALDLRAAIAGCHASRSRILGLLKKYGAETTKGVMQKMLNTGEAAFLDRLQSIPDGVWRERTYQEVALTGDRGVYKIEITLTKKGNTLIFDNAGTDPQVGAINVPFAGWRGTILSAINVLMLPEQMGAMGGAIQHLEFNPTPGTITCPDYGVAVSPAGIYGNELAIAMANSVISKMLLSSQDISLRKLALTSTQAQWHINIHAGINQKGEYYVGPMLDAMIGSTGATPAGDGYFANGVWWIPEGQGPNVESYERDWPILYLYRKEQQDTGGAGRFRGGNGGIAAYIPYKGKVSLGVYSTEGIPKTLGLQGGLPGGRGETLHIRNSNIHELFSEGIMPSSVDTVQGELNVTYGKGLPLDLGNADIIEWNWGSCSGYGDPIDRDPERVKNDIHNGIVSQEYAEKVYGVLLNESGEVDSEATNSKRLEIRSQRFRLGGGNEPDTLPLTLESKFIIPEEASVIGDYLFIMGSDSEVTVGCACCGTTLAHEHQDYKSGCLSYQAPIEEAGKHFVDPRRYVDQDVFFIQYFCPGCATTVATEVKREGDEYLVEFEINNSSKVQVNV